MNLLDVDIVKIDDALKLNVNAYSPTLGWTDISLSIVVYFMPPIDGIQDVILNGTPPEGYTLTSLMVYPLSIVIPSNEWLQGVRILNEKGISLLTVRTPVKKRDPIGKDWVAIENAGLKGDKLILDIRYGGGCKQHIFQLNWNGDVLKSNPPQIILDLSHNAHEDPCKALLSERLQYDLSTILDDNPKDYIIRVHSLLTEVIAHKPKTQIKKE